MESSYEIKTVPSGDLSFLCGLTISIQLGNDKTKHYCKCRGISPSKFLLIQTPAAISSSIHLNQHSPIIIRYIYNGTVMGFEAQIIQSIHQPYRLLFISYPDQLDQHLLRTCERAEVLIPAKFSLADAELSAVIRDLSCNGCMLVLDEGSDTGLISKGEDQVGFLSFSTDISQEKINVGCKIVRVRSDKNKTELGIEFDSSAREPLDLITQYVDHILTILA